MELQLLVVEITVAVAVVVAMVAVEAWAMVCANGGVDIKLASVGGCLMYPMLVILSR